MKPKNTSPLTFEKFKKEIVASGAYIISYPGTAWGNDIICKLKLPEKKTKSTYLSISLESGIVMISEHSPRTLKKKCTIRRRYGLQKMYDKLKAYDLYVLLDTIQEHKS